MMSRITSLVRNTAIETYILGLFPLVFMAIVLILHGELHNRIDEDFLKASMYYVFFGWTFLLDAVVVVYVYMTIRLTLYAGVLFRAAVDKEYELPNAKDSKHTLRTVISVLYLFTVFSTGLLSAMIIAFGVYLADPFMVEGASNTVMDMDKAVYGSYTSYALHALFENPFFSKLFLVSYNFLGGALSIVFIGLLISNQKRFRKFVATFILIPIFSSLIWFVMPVVSPSEMYRRDIFQNLPATHITQYISPTLIQLDPHIEIFLDRVESQKSRPEKGYYADTAYPSMHVAWGALATFYAVLIWWPLAFFFVPWQIFNIIGAVYSLQHYAIDTLLGLAVMALVTILVQVAFRFEARFLVPGTYFHQALDVVRNDVRWTGKTLRSIGKYIWRKLIPKKST
jgi:Flp pilus assembly protein TadB